MEVKTEILMYLLFNLFLLFAKSLTSGTRDIFTWVLYYYFYVAFGPVITYLIDFPIYHGIPTEYILPAVKIFTLANLAMIFSGMLFRPKLYEKPVSEFRIYESLPTIKIFAVLSLLYTAIAIPALLANLDGSKLDKISVISPLVHYNYLFVQLFLPAFYFHYSHEKIGRRIFWLNFITYCFYCILTAERDFIFPLSSIGFHWAIYNFNDRRNIVKFAACGLVLVSTGVGVFLLRDTTQDSSNPLISMLNQGSLLFINSYCLYLVDMGQELFTGFTYINSLQNLLPSWLYGTDFSVIAWFKEQYAPNSTSGYGFALDAEAYINFGYIGVFVFFFLIATYQKIIYNNLDKHHYLVFYSVFFHSFFMYNLRNDSLALFKGNLYAALFFIFILYTSRMINYLAEKNEALRKFRI